MTMMSSLKAFLFASPAQGAMTSGVAVPAPGGEGSDFAVLLGGIAQAPAATGPGGALPMPNPVLPVPTEGETRALPLDMQPLPLGDPLALPPGNSLPVETSVTDIRLPAHTDAPILMGRPDAAIAETEGDALPVEPDDDADQPKIDASATIAVATATIAPPIVLPPAIVNPPAMPVSVPEEASVKSQEAKPLAAISVTRKSGDGGIPVTPPALDAQQANASEPLLPQGEIPATPTGLPVGSTATGLAVPATDQAATMAQATAPQSSQQVLATAPAPAAPPMAAQAMVSTIVGLAAKDAGPSATPAVDLPIDGNTQPTVMPVPNAPAPVKSEALSLLQLVREHFVRREGDASTETASPVAAPRTADPAAVDSTPAASLAMLAPGQTIAPASAPATGAIQAMPASVDLGGTIAGQVVDMGVQGQWIDGLAKDIASLSADGAQGRFQIRSDHLGAVQVNIRPSATGTTVSLTVASDAAQQALQADGDRLIADAALSAMKITDLRVERGTISEAQRSDSAGQQQSGSNGQSQTQNQAQNGSQATGQGQGQGLGQGLSQGMGQNRSDHRDNFSGNHKSGPDSAVLPQADSREGEATGVRRAASRARYA